MNKPINKSKICITGLGMVTSVGHDVKTACASIRAEITRPRQLDNFFVFSPEGYEDEEDGLVTGHPVLNADDPDDIDAAETRIRILLSMVIDDLYKYSKADQSLADSPLFLSIPEHYRSKINQEKIKQYISENPDHFPFSCKDISIFDNGNAGMFFALTDARNKIEQGQYRQVIIAGIDSLIGYDDLLMFNNQKRLKTELNPEGFLPGEAASAILVETVETAEKRKASIEAVIDKISIGHENDNILSESFATGKGLADVISEMIDENDNEERLSPDTIISDMNGESYRAEELSYIQPKIWSRISGEKNIKYPAKQLGETGAAYAGIGICMATRAMKGGYIKSDIYSSDKHKGNALILASSDSGSRGAVYLKSYDMDN